MRFAFALLLLLCFAPLAFGQQTVVDFEDLTLDPESAYFGADNAGGFASRGAQFNNTFTDFGGGFTGWIGFSYSNITDVATAGFGNQFSAYHLPGGGGDGSSNYGLGFAYSRGEAVLTLPVGSRLSTVRVTNTTYAGLAMLNGDSFSKRFGGATGLEPDFFSVTFHGLDANGAATGSVEFFLADYRFAGTADDYIVDEWTTVDLSALGEGTRRIELEFASSDVGPFGLNTPTYVALDNLTLTAIPEPGTLAALGALATGAVAWRRRHVRRRLRKQGGAGRTRGPRCGPCGAAV